MNGKLFSLILLLIVSWTDTSAQELISEEVRIAFYNVENLFDTKDNPDIPDDGFTPEGSKKWTEDRYQTKLHRISRVLDSLDFPTLIGLAEVENKNVLRDLIDQTSLSDRGYKIIHRNSPDERGIDVALLYRDQEVELIDSSWISIELHPSVAEDPHTRDILKSSIRIYQDTVVVYVNHWPSRAGGRAATEKARKAVARILRNDIQKELRTQPKRCIINMGDFNDEPVNSSIKEVLSTGSADDVLQHRALLFNTSLEEDKNGKGSYNYRGSWDMLDQIMISGCFLKGSPCRKYIDSKIFNASWLMYEDDRFGERPNRTYGGPNYYGGFSDHLPVYADFCFCRSVL